MTSLVTKAEFARMHGKSRAAITQWGALGRLVMQGDMVDVDASNELLEKYRKGGAGALSAAHEVNPVRLTVTAGESPESIAANILATSGVEWSIDEAKRVKENYLALLNQLEYDQKSGLVVAAAEVAALVGAEYAKVRTKLLALPSEQAPRLYRLKTVTEVQDALLAMVVEALEGLTRDRTAPSN